MKKGEKAVLTCTQENAYGDQSGHSWVFPPAMMRFEVELVSWKSQAKSEL
jgi:FKBP-type peptidyl-prolyl cis-trans isomerase